MANRQSDRVKLKAGGLKPDPASGQSPAGGTPGGAGGFADMFSALPSAEAASGSAETAGGKSPVSVPDVFSDMFANLPDAGSSHAGDRGSDHQHHAGASNESEFDRRAAGQARRPAHPTHPKPARPAPIPQTTPEPEDIFSDLDGQTEETFDSPALPARQAPATRNAAKPAEIARRQSPASFRPTSPKESPEPTDDRSLSREIIDHLEKHRISSVSQLRIEVHDGIVVVAGEVPTAYEKQLVSHFCRQLSGVRRYVDAMVIRGPVRQSDVRPAGSRRSNRAKQEWKLPRLPFRAWHAGAALGLTVLVWGAISLGRANPAAGHLAVYPMTGELQFEGQPADGATIILHSQNPEVPVRPCGIADPDGTLKFTTYVKGDGVPAGKYKATIEWRRPVAGQAGGEDIPPNVLPPAFANVRTTPIEVIVEEGDNSFPQIHFQN